MGGVSDIRERLEAYSSAGLDEVALAPMTAGDPSGGADVAGDGVVLLRRRCPPVGDGALLRSCSKGGQDVVG